MERPAVWEAATGDRSHLFDRPLTILRRRSARFCVIDDHAVNACAEPVVSLDLDLARAADDLEPLLTSLGPEFTVERFPHRVNVSAPGSALRVQFQLDPRYAAFVTRAQEHDVLGIRLPVAQIQDRLRGRSGRSKTPRAAPANDRRIWQISRACWRYSLALRGSVPQAILDRLL